MGELRRICCDGCDLGKVRSRRPAFDGKALFVRRVVCPTERHRSFSVRCRQIAWGVDEARVLIHLDAQGDRRGGALVIGDGQFSGKCPCRSVGVSDRSAGAGPAVTKGPSVRANRSVRIAGLGVAELSG